jgi:hypothetical protein
MRKDNNRLTEKDWLFHPRSDHPHWNESAWFGFHIPERRINGWIHINHRPNMNYSIAGVGLWDPTGEEIYDCLYHSWNDPVPLPEGSQMFDFSLMNGIKLKTIEPFKAVEIRFQDDDIELELTWESFMEPQIANFQVGLDEFGHGHYEQGGHMEGRVVTFGEELEIDCWSNRDHSWGPRRFWKNPRGDFPWAVANEKAAFHCLAISDQHPDDDPVVGTKEKVVAGWYVRDGQVAKLDSGHRQVTERGPDGRPELVTIDAHDELGRDLHAQATILNWLRWPGYANYFQWWMLAEWRFDGHQAYGDVSEWFPAYAARRFIRTRRAQMHELAD